MTKTDWTAEEVRAVASKLHVPNEWVDINTLAAMLTAFAERIAADESAVPVAYMVSDNGWNQCFTTLDQCRMYGHELIPLFTNPPAQPAQEQPRRKVPDGITVKVSGYLPKQRAVEIRFDEPLPAWICEPGVSVVVATPAQTVDVGAIREVIELLNETDATLSGTNCDEWANKLSQAIGDKT